MPYIQAAIDRDQMMVACLENGIVPHVILPDGQDAYDLEIGYAEAECDPKSTESGELKKCLHAGVVPESYEEYVTDMKVVEVRRLVPDEQGADEAEKSIYGTDAEMKEAGQLLLTLNGADLAYTVAGRATGTYCRVDYNAPRCQSPFLPLAMKAQEPRIEYRRGEEKKRALRIENQIAS